MFEVQRSRVTIQTTEEMMRREWERREKGCETAGYAAMLMWDACSSCGEDGSGTRDQGSALMQTGLEGNTLATRRRQTGEW